MRSYLIDFGSTLGSSTMREETPRAGHAYIIEPDSWLLTIVTLGLYRPRWMRTPSSGLPAAGRFSADHFEPEQWKPDYPNPAFDNAQAGDLFWAARRVALVSNDMIHAVVKTAAFSDPRVDDDLTRALIARRDKIARTWLTHINPLVDFRIGQDRTLRWTNAAVDARVVSVRPRYRVQFGRFDNRTGTVAAHPGELQTDREQIAVPSDVRTLRTAFVVVTVSTLHPEYTSWRAPVRAYFRRVGNRLEPVGLERVLPESN